MYTKNYCIKFKDQAILLYVEHQCLIIVAKPNTSNKEILSRTMLYIKLLPKLSMDYNKIF